MHKPDGYPDLSAYLIVADAEAAMQFAEAAFGAKRLRVMPRAGGGIEHAEIRVGDSVVMMGEVPEASPSHLHLYLADVEAAWARALAAGGTVVQDLALRDDGDRRGGVTAPCGTTWWLARQERQDG